jgi:drug/metabolite transporter (DMT)-like permease
VLVGVVSFVALNRAIAALGCMKASAFISAVPVLTAIIAIPVLGEQPPFADCAALLLITLGAVLASRVPHDAATPPTPSVYEHGPTRLTRATRNISGASTG